jgi:hypothetical protein
MLAIRPEIESIAQLKDILESDVRLLFRTRHGEELGVIAARRHRLNDGSTTIHFSYEDRSEAQMREVFVLSCYPPSFEMGIMNGMAPRGIYVAVRALVEALATGCWPRGLFFEVA